jgi:hypothetical protein
MYTPPPFGCGGEGTLNRGDEGGVPIPTRGQTLWYSRYMCTLWEDPRGQCILFSVVFTPSPSRGSVLLLISVSSLLITNTVAPVRVCQLPIHVMGEVSWDQNEEAS